MKTPENFGGAVLDKSVKKAASERMDLSDGTPKAYLEARSLVDIGVATMTVDEEGNRVQIRKNDGEILIDTNKFSVLERAYLQYRNKGDERILREHFDPKGN